jgi:predicted dehydrogenase
VATIGANPAVYGSSGGVALLDGELVKYGLSGVTESDKSKYGKETDTRGKVEVPVLEKHLANAPELAVWALNNGGLSNHDVVKVLDGEMINAEVALMAQRILEAGLVSAREGRVVSWSEAEKMGDGTRGKM